MDMYFVVVNIPPVELVLEANVEFRDGCYLCRLSMDGTTIEETGNTDCAAVFAAIRSFPGLLSKYPNLEVLKKKWAGYQFWNLTNQKYKLDETMDRNGCSPSILTIKRRRK